MKKYRAITSLFIIFLTAFSFLFYFVFSTSAVYKVRTVYTSAWKPPSPDPMGITYDWQNGKLLITDSEIDEMSIFTGINYYEASPTGTLLRTASTINFSYEPTDIAINPDNNHYFFSDDDVYKIDEVSIGNDGLFGTADDTNRSFSVTGYGVQDPEGVAYGAGGAHLGDGSRHPWW